MRSSRPPHIEPVHVEEAEKLKALYKRVNSGPDKLSQAEFGARFGIGGQGMVWQYLNAHSALSLDAALKFARGLKCDVCAFSPRLAAALPPPAYREQADQGAMSAAMDEEKRPGESWNLYCDYAFIPAYPVRISNSSNDSPSKRSGGRPFDLVWLSAMQLRAESLCVITAIGASMAPTIQDAEELLIDRSKTNAVDGKVFALDRGGEIIARRLVRDFSGGWIVRCDNPDKPRFGDIAAAAADLHIIGRVVWRGGILR